jgi:hypothetical protein
MVKVIELLAYENTAPRPGTNLRKFIGVTIHDTGNPSPTADAKAHAELLRGAWKTRDTSWHYAVDQDVAYRSIPEDEVSWHAGDGANGTGNNETVSIESCVNAGADYNKTMANMAWLAADILFRHGIKQAATHLFQHNHWSGKDCPKYIRDHLLWDRFVANVQTELFGMWANTEVEKVKIPSTMFRVIDPVFVKAGPDIGKTPTIRLRPYDEVFVGTELTEADGYVWVRSSEGWTALGTSDGSEYYLRVEMDVSEYTKQINDLKKALADATARIAGAKLALG